MVAGLQLPSHVAGRPIPGYHLELVKLYRNDDVDNYGSHFADPIHCKNLDQRDDHFLRGPIATSLVCNGTWKHGRDCLFPIGLRALVDWA